MNTDMKITVNPGMEHLRQFVRQLPELFPVSGMSVFIYTAKLRQTIGLDSPFWAQYWLIGWQSGFGLFVLSLFVCLKRPPLPETSAWGRGVSAAGGPPPRPASFALGISAAGGPLPSAPPVPCQAFPPK